MIVHDQRGINRRSEVGVPLRTTYLAEVHRSPYMVLSWRSINPAMSSHHRMVLGVDLARLSFRRRRWTARDQLMRPDTRSSADSGAVRQDLRSKINRPATSNVQAISALHAAAGHGRVRRRARVPGLRRTTTPTLVTDAPRSSWQSPRRSRSGHHQGPSRTRSPGDSVSRDIVSSGEGSRSCSMPSRLPRRPSSSTTWC